MLTGLMYQQPVQVFSMPLSTGAMMIESGRYKKVMVIGSDKNELHC